MLRLLRPVLCVASLLAAGCGGDSSQKLYQEARSLRARGDANGAIIQLKNAIQKNPENRDARFLLGQIYLDDGQFASAEKELRKALESGHEKNPVLPKLGQALLAQGEFEKLLTEVAAQPAMSSADKADVLALRGNALLAKGKLAEGKAALLEARRVDANNLHAYLGLANLALAERNVNEALSLAETAIVKNPGKADGWLVKGAILAREGRLPEAAQAFESGVKAEPRSVKAHAMLGGMYLDQGKYPEARSQLDQARKIRPGDIQTLYLLAAADFREKKLVQARDQVQLILRSAPTHAPSLVLSGAVNLALGAHEQAEKSLAYVVQNIPQYLQARRLLAMTYLKMNEPKKAMEILSPVAKETTDGPTLALLGEAHMRAGDHAKASEYLDRAVAVLPHSVQARANLGLSRLAMGNPRGFDDLEQASDLNETQYGADLMLVMAHVSRKEWDRALEAITTLEKKQPGNPAAYQLKGAVHAGKKDFVKARKAFEQAVAVAPDFLPALSSLARLDLEAGKPDDARKRFEQVLAKNSANVQAMLALASIEQSLGREKAMVDWLEKAVKADASALLPRARLAQYHQHKGDTARAMVLARAAQAANPKRPEALDLLGSLQLATGDKNGALASFSQLTALAPQSASAQLKLAQAQLANDNDSAARNSIDRALELQPDLADVKVAKIALEVKEKRYPAALEIARGLQKQMPDSGLGWALEGDVAMAQGRAATAAEAYRAALKLEPASGILLKLHMAQSRQGQQKEADAQLAQWLKARPDDHLARGVLADSHMRQGQVKAAIVEYETLLKSLPDNIVALNNLAWLYLQQKDARAVAAAERAYKLKPNVPQIMDTLGWVHVQQGELKRGTALIQQAFSGQPDQPTVHYHLAAAMAKQGDRTRALHEIERLLARGLSFPEEREARALLDQLKGANR